MSGHLLDEDRIEAARAAGLPDPPPGRICLLRSPWPRLPITVIRDELIWPIVLRAEPGSEEISEFYLAARVVLAWDESEARAALPAPTRARLDAWAAIGRIGEDAAAFIERKIDPVELWAALAQTGLDESALLGWLDGLDAGLDADVIAFIRSWQAAGLPGDPPLGAHRFRDRNLAELRAWLDAGFDLYAAARLERAGLDTALRWRAAGFGPADTYELLRADPALIPDEARAFDSVGSARARRREWIYFGFTAAEAAGWASAGLSPAEARVWRAAGSRPADVEPGQWLPPQLDAGQGQRGLSARDWAAVQDPPGTRGRRARRWAGDDNPWINDD
jgi:hypothetical protein